MGGKHGDEAPPKWRVGATFGAFRTTLLFSDGTSPRFEQLAVSASLEYRLSEKVTLVGAGGALLAGSLGGAPTAPGGVGSLALSYLVLEQGKYTPFLQVSGSLAVSAFRGPAAPYTALDFRAGLVAGYTFLERLTPYAVFRAFGGPVFYGDALGTDAYHVQLGAGLVVGLPFGFDLSAEVIPLGEQRVTAGLGFTF
jgi:hypothetical protein